MVGVSYTHSHKSYLTILSAKFHVKNETVPYCKHIARVTQVHIITKVSSRMWSLV